MYYVRATKALKGKKEASLKWYTPNDKYIVVKFQRIYCKYSVGIDLALLKDNIYLSNKHVGLLLKQASVGRG